MTYDTIRIRDVRKNDLIQAEDEKTGQYSWNRVESVKAGAQTFELKLKGGWKMVEPPDRFVNVRRLRLVKCG